MKTKLNLGAKFFIGILTLGIQMKADAHTKLTSPVPRDPGGNGGNKVGPCGGFAKVPNPTTTFTAGSNVTVTWTETINHPGKFLFAISSDNDVTFKNFATIIDDQNTSGAHNSSASLKIPDVQCTSCTLQIIQSMEENPLNPTYYYSCADVKIDKATTPPTTPAPPVIPPPTTPPTTPPITPPNSPPTSPTGTPVQTFNNQSTTPIPDKPKFGGCGRVELLKLSSLLSAQQNEWREYLLLLVIFSWVFMMPLIFWILLNRLGHVTK